MTDLLVAADVGTSRLKVGVFDLSGELVAFAQGECAPSYLPDHRVELDAQRWWQVFAASLESCLENIDRASIRAIGVSSQANTYVLLDASGNALRPAVSWLDTCGDAEGAAQVLARFDFYEHTGWPRPLPGLALCKLRRLAADGALSGVEHVLFADGYLMFRLTGSAAVSRNLAAMSGLYSMRASDWWLEAVSAARVPHALLPVVCDMGQGVGELDASLARRWGISRVPVVAGANDQTAAALGAGLCEPRQTTLGLGTAWAAYQVIQADAPWLPSRPLRGPYPGGLQYQLQFFDTAGALLEWVRATFAPERDWDDFFAQALSVEPGCDGLRAVPGYTAEHDMQRGSTLTGLHLRHGWKHVARAFLEGLGCVLRELLDQFSATDVVRVTGGGSANDAWLQTIADIRGRTLERLDQPHAGLWGTALMAGYGAGLFGNILESVRATRRSGKRFVPRKDHAEAYERVYDDYSQAKEAATKNG